MKLSLVKLDDDKCKEYLYRSINDVGYFGKEIVACDILSRGKFYCIIPTDAVHHDLYSFDTGGRVFPYSRSLSGKDGIRVEEANNYAEDITLTLIKQYLEDIEAKDDRYLIMEDFLRKPGDKFVETEQFRYYLAGTTMVYIIRSATEASIVEDYYNIADNFRFMPMLVDCTLGNITAGKQLDGSILDDITNSISVLFYKIYDGESFLIWVNDKCTDVIERLSGLL